MGQNLAAGTRAGPGGERSGTVRTGGCACGAVRFSVRGEPWRVGLCHCITCRKVHGAPFHAFAIFPAGAVAVSGPTRAWRSSPWAERVFCPACGSHVLVHEDGSDEIELMLGSFDAPDQFRPAYENWVIRRESWLPPLAEQQYNRNRQGSGRTE